MSLPGWRSALALLLGSLLAPCLSLAGGERPERIVAVGDIHGAFDQLVTILQAAELLDERRQWVGGRAVLVQTGDFLDRGRHVREVMDLLIELQEQAPRAGGRVIVLLGNHEAMNLTGTVRDVNPEVYADFVDQRSPKRRRAAFRKLFRLLRERAERYGFPEPENRDQIEASWLASHPEGYVEYQQALAPRGEYGRWLRTLPTATRVGDIVFIHGGIHPELATLTAEEISRRVAADIKTYDEYRRFLEAEGLAPFFFTPTEQFQAAGLELARLKAVMEAVALQTTVVRPTPAEQARIERFQGMLDFAGGLLYDPDGPVWFRGFAEWSEEEGGPQVDALLAALDAGFIVAAHTPQPNGEITVRFEDRVFLIDTGMLPEVYKSGQASALEIRNGRFTAVYPDRREVLLDGR